MKFKIAILTILSLILLISCTTVKKIPVATGGSRADGVVELAYEYDSAGKPIVMWEKAEETACEKCQAWGYASAQAFGGAKVDCVQYDRYENCLKQRVTIPYQCIGNVNTERLSQNNIEEK